MSFLKIFKEFKDHLFRKENILNLIIIVTIFILDRLSKLSILKNFNESTYFFNDFINFDLIWNIGIGFGLFSTDSMVIYNIITLIIALVIVVLLYIL